VSDTVRGALLVFAASLGFATLGTLSSISYGEGMGPAAFVTLRAVLGAALLGILLAARPRLWSPLSSLARREQVMLGAAVAINGAFNLVLFAAFQATDVGIVLAIYFSYPVIVWLASVALRRERVTAARIVALGLAMVGVVLIVAERLIGAHTAPIGLALAVAAALGQASYIVVARHGFPSVGAEQAITLVLLGGALMAGAAALLADGVTAFTGEWTTSIVAWLAVLAAAILATAAAKVWVLRGLRLLGGTRTAVIQLVEPVGGLVLAALILGQALSRVEIAGGLLVLAAAVIVQVPARAGAAAE
jgi:drug/metabolite transporter (DMT)-like permease